MRSKKLKLRSTASERAQFLRAPVAQHLAQVRGRTPCASATVETIRGDEVVLQFENAFRTERAIVGLGPQMGARLGVDELHRDADLASRLAKGPVDHVARAQLMADGAHVGRLARVAKRGAARDHPRREAQHAHHDALGQPVGQRREVRAATCELERQHRDPEALVPRGRLPNRRAVTGREAGGERARRRGPDAQQGAQRLAQLTRRREPVGGTLRQTPPDHHLPHPGRQVAPQLGERRAARRAGLPRPARPTRRPETAAGHSPSCTTARRARRGRCGDPPQRPATCSGDMYAGAPITTPAWGPAPPT